MSFVREGAARADVLFEEVAQLLLGTTDRVEGRRGVRPHDPGWCDGWLELAVPARSSPRDAQHPGDAWRAVRAALAMQNALAVQNAERAALALPGLEHTVGIHGGPAVAGNIGTASHLEYTVIGDTVNVASRVEGLCRTVNARVLITAQIVRQLGARAAGLTLVDHGEQPLRG